MPETLDAGLIAEITLRTLAVCGAALALAVAIGVPIGVLAGVYLSEYGAGGRLAGPVRFIADVLAGVGR